MKYYIMMQDGREGELSLRFRGVLAELKRQGWTYDICTIDRGKACILSRGGTLVTIAGMRGFGADGGEDGEEQDTISGEWTGRVCGVVDAVRNDIVTKIMAGLCAEARLKELQE